MTKESNLSKFALYALSELQKYVTKREWNDSSSLAYKLVAKANSDKDFANKLELYLQLRVDNPTVYLRELCDIVLNTEDSYFKSLKIGNAVDGLDSAYLCFSQRVGNGHQDVEEQTLGSRVNAKETVDILNSLGHLTAEQTDAIETRNRNLRLINVAHGNKHVYLTVCTTSATYWLSSTDMAPIGSARFISHDVTEYKEDLERFFDFILLRS